MVNQGDILILSFNSQLGREQKGVRPAIVLSNSKFHKYFPQMAIVCPITTTDRNWGSHVKLPDSLKTTGFVMCEQLKLVDLKSRKKQFVEHATDDFVDKILNIIKMFF